MPFKIKSAVLPILIITIIAFIAQAVFGNSFTAGLSLIGGSIFTRPWTILTHMFMHANMTHIFFNMYALFLFGPLLEHTIGAKRFLLVYLAAGLIAGITAGVFLPAGQLALGASGAIMGMLGVVIILMPNLRLLFFFIIPMPLWLAGIIWAAIDFFGLVAFSGIANLAHLVGLGVGILYGLKLKKKTRRFHKSFVKKSHLGDDDIDEYLKSGRI